MIDNGETVMPFFVRLILVVTSLSSLALDPVHAAADKDRTNSGEPDSTLSTQRIGAKTHALSLSEDSSSSAGYYLSQNKAKQYCEVRATSVVHHILHDNNFVIHVNAFNECMRAIECTSSSEESEPKQKCKDKGFGDQEFEKFTSSLRDIQWRQAMRLYQNKNDILALKSNDDYLNRADRFKIAHPDWLGPLNDAEAYAHPLSFGVMDDLIGKVEDREEMERQAAAATAGRNSGIAEPRR